MKKVAVCFSTDENYVQHMCVAIASILKNKTPDVDLHVYIIDGGISLEKKELIQKLKKIAEFTLTYVTPKHESIFELLQIGGNDRITFETYYRMFIPQWIPEEKVLYLDCDMVILSDLTKLYDWRLDGSFLLGVKDIDEIYHRKKLNTSKYVNGGVLLFNNKAIQTENYLQQIVNWIKNNANKITCHDQDILNGAFNNKISYVPEVWNVQLSTSNQLKARRFRNLKEKKILHFISRDKPWNPKFYFIPYRERYFEYLKLTPFKNFEHCYALKAKKFKFFYSMKKGLLKLISPVFSKKQSFYGTYNNYRILGFTFKKTKRWYLRERKNK